MRRSICYCEPSHATTGQITTWQFIYTSSTDIPKGTLLKFDLLCEGKPSDWQIPQVTSKDSSNLIWAILPNGKALKPKPIETEDSFQFEFQLPSPIKTGEKFCIYLGSPKNTPEKGNRAQTCLQRRKMFYLYIDPKGQGDYKEPEIFHIDIRGNVLKNLKILTPSIVSRNKRFDVVVRFEDAYSNLTGNAPDGTLIELSYDNLRENLSWKLFVPETGFITLPNLYFNEPGIYKIKLKNLKTSETFYSAPIKCFADTEINLFWGLLHGENEKVDAGENIENCLRYCRDEKSLQFFSTSPFDSEEETSNDLWKSICHHVAEFNEEERFVSFLGLQWMGEEKEEGLRQFVFLKDSKPILRKKDLKNNALKKIYKTFQPKEFLSIPSFTMGSSSLFDFTEFCPEYERVVEIYNAWGSSECMPKEGNAYPIQSSDKKGVFGKQEGSILKALLNNCRFGFVAGGLDDRGIYSDFFDQGQTQYSPGLTAIFAKNQTRESILDALYNRHCYATTGERMILGFSIAEEPMGSELNVQKKPGLEFNRYISGYVIGTAPLKEVIIFRNGQILTKFQPNNFQLDFQFDDTEPLSKHLLKAKDDKPPFVFYYLKAIQEDGHTAWSSPVWIDGMIPTEKAKKKKQD